MKAAIYLRVSTDRCRHCRRDSHDPDDKCSNFEPDQTEANQEPDCLRLCAARGWDPVIVRERESGAKERPGWRTVVEMARRGQVGAVVFWALDRIGRKRVQVAHDISELARFRVAIVSVQDAWLDQPDGPLRDLLVQLMAWVAEGERRRLIERTRAGLARAKREGKRFGRPPVPDDVRARVLAAAELHASPMMVAHATGVPLRTCQRILARQKGSAKHAA
jgi:DNA invertase Pin-like site-specific DNA recombinase